ncbi:MAG: tetratricopeptide repeat protein [Planctomycetia bacterium]|nr:MAG: tetratricopeptide repeat protein [Planctomycetia bacterium]
MAIDKHSPVPRLRTVACLLAVISAAAAPAQATPPDPLPAPAGSTTAAVHQFRSAVALHNRGVYDLAAEQWAVLLRDHPADPLVPKAGHYLGICHLQLKQFDQAERTLADIANRFPDAELLPVTLLNLGLAQFNLGQQGKPEALDRAAATLDRLLKQFPDHEHAATARYYQSEAWYALDRKADAIGGFEEFLSRYPKHGLMAKVLYALGVARQEVEDFAPAQAVYERFVASFPEHELANEVRMRLGEVLLASGQVAEAKARFDSVAAIAGFAYADCAIMRQAECHMQLKQYAAAADRYAALTARYPDSQYVPLADLAGGKCHFLAGNPGAAIEPLTRARQHDGPIGLEAAHWLVRCHLKEKHPAAALAVAEQALAGAEGSPSEIDLAMDRGDALYDLVQRRKEAVEAYCDVVATNPDDAQAPRAAYMAAYVALETGQLDRAGQLARDFLAAHPQDELVAEVQAVAADALLAGKAYGEAAQLYRQTLAEHPDHADADGWRLREAFCLVMQEEFAEALARLQPIVGRLDGQPAAEAQQLIGEGHFALKQYAEAAAAFQASLDALARGPQTDRALLGLAQSQYGLGHAADAQATLQKLLADFPQSKLLDRAYYDLGQWTAAAGADGQAAAAYQKLIDRFPDSSLAPHALFGLGWVQLDRQDHAAAEATMSRLIDTHGDHPLAARAHHARAVARQEMGRNAAALEDIEVFLETPRSRPQTSTALYLRGRCQAGLKRYAEAVATYQTILDEDPEFASADRVLYELAWAQHDLGRAAEALKTFAQLAEKYPQSPLAAECLLRVAEASYTGGQYAEAADAYRLAADRGESTPIAEQALHKLGWCRFQRQEHAEAREVFEEQLRRFAQGKFAGDARVMQAECLFQEGKYPAARAAFAQARAIGGGNDELRLIALLHAAQAAAQLKAWSDALQLADQCQRQFPESDYRDEIDFERAWALQHLERLKDAEALYEALSGRNNQELGARARFMIGEIQFERKEYRTAVRSFFQVAYGYGGENAPVQLRVWQADAMFDAARCLEQLDRPEPAGKLYAELLERFPDSSKGPLAKRKLEALNRGQ